MCSPSKVVRASSCRSAGGRNYQEARSTGLPFVAALLTAIIVLAAQGPRDEAAAEVSGQGATLPPVSRTLSMPPQSQIDSTGVVLAVGDRLKLLFLERISSGSGPPAPVAQNAIERAELTGEYTVQSDGTLFLPVLGQVPMSGTLLPAAQEELQALYKKVYGKEARTSISLVSREPVYVLGPVLKPGTFEYSPGMTVLHALALAGGMHYGSAANAEYLDMLRERQRLEQSGERQKKLLAKHAVFRAERTGKPVAVPDSLVALGTRTAAERLIAEFGDGRKPVLESRLLKIKSLQSTIEAARRELGSQRKRIAHITSNVESKEARTKILKGLMDAGNMRGAMFLQAKSELSDIRERLDEALGNKAQVEDRIDQAINEKQKVETDWRVELERDIALTEESLSEEQAVSAASAQVLRLSNPRTAGGELGNISYQIHRRTSKGIEEMTASEGTPLEPGDLVRIRSVPAGVGPNAELKKEGRDWETPSRPEANTDRVN